MPLINLCLANFELLQLPEDPQDRSNHKRGAPVCERVNEFMTILVMAQYVTIDVIGSLEAFPILQEALHDKNTVLLYPGPQAVLSSFAYEHLQRIFECAPALTRLIQSRRQWQSKTCPHPQLASIGPLLLLTQPGGKPTESCEKTASQALSLVA